MKIEDLEIGDCVNVKRQIGDQFNHDFTGHVHSIVGNDVVVKDQDDDCWCCDASQLTFSSDDDLHK